MTAPGLFCDVVCVVGGSLDGLVEEVLNQLGVRQRGRSTPRWRTNIGSNHSFIALNLVRLDRQSRYPNDGKTPTAETSTQTDQCAD